MNIHEYQAKQILSKYGINVPKGYLVENIENAEKQARKIETLKAVVKAQIHSGGRGKAGGVVLVDSLTGAINACQELLGKTLITNQTGRQGKLVRKVYIEESCNIEKEYYLSMLVDRTSESIALIVSYYGGMDIEEIAKTNPDKINKFNINIELGIEERIIKEVLNILEISNIYENQLGNLLRSLFDCLVENDLMMLEINPLVFTTENTFVVLDAKMVIDDNALFRHIDFIEMQDEYEENAKEIEAKKEGLSYIALDGNIGCLVNGAGLAMATMDAIKYEGGNPANFLDIGGSATGEMIEKALDLLAQDEEVKGIFVNIFGGIMECDRVANAIVSSMKNKKRNIPLVVRLEGNKHKEGRVILENSGLDICFAETMHEGAKQIINAKF